MVSRGAAIRVHGGRLHGNMEQSRWGYGSAAGHLGVCFWCEERENHLAGEKL